MFIWFDVTNPYHVGFISTLYSKLKKEGFNLVVTAVDTKEVKEELSRSGIFFKVVGKQISTGQNELALFTSRVINLYESIKKELEGDVIHVSFLSPSAFRCASGLSKPVVGLIPYQINGKPFTQISLSLADHLVKSIFSPLDKHLGIYLNKTACFKGLYEVSWLKRELRNLVSAELLPTQLENDYFEVSLFHNPLFPLTGKNSFPYFLYSKLFHFLQVKINPRKLKINIYPRKGTEILLPIFKGKNTTLSYIKRRDYLKQLISSDLVLSVDFKICLESAILNKVAVFLTLNRERGPLLSSLRKTGLPVWGYMEIDENNLNLEPRIRKGKNNLYGFLNKLEDAVPLVSEIIKEYF